MDFLVEILGVAFIIWIAYICGVDVGRRREREAWRLSERLEEENDPERRAELVREISKLRAGEPR